MAVISVFISLLSIATLWLIIPIFILPPLAFFIGLKAHRRFKADNPTPSSLAEFLSLAPMFFAIAAFVFDFYILATGYKA